MRWVWFAILTVLAAVFQTTVLQVIWVRTRVGDVGPEVLVAVAVFAALHARSRTDAALFGWMTGFAADLMLTGPGMGLMSLLYMSAAVAVHSLREVVFRDRAVAQMVLAGLFCLFADSLLKVYDVLSGEMSGSVLGGQLIRCGAVAGYTALLAPVFCRVLHRIGKLFLPVSSGRQRR